jgi:hypothetical protein
MTKRLAKLLSVLCVLLLPTLAAAEEVWVAETQATSSGGSYYSYYLTVRVGVWPVAPGHSVGMVYTNDNWNTTHQVDLTWQYNQSNAYGSQDELWRTPTLYVSDSAPVEYAVYVDDAYGNRTWNNNNGQNFRFSRM